MQLVLRQTTFAGFGALALVAATVPAPALSAALTGVHPLSQGGVVNSRPAPASPHHFVNGSHFRHFPLHRRGRIWSWPFVYSDTSPSPFFETETALVPEFPALPEYVGATNFPLGEPIPRTCVTSRKLVPNTHGHLRGVTVVRC